MANIDNVDFLISDCSSLPNWIQNLESDMLEDLIGVFDEATKGLLVENGCEILANTEDLEDFNLTPSMTTTLYLNMLREIEIEYLSRKRILVDKNKPERQLTLKCVLGNDLPVFDIEIIDPKKLERVLNEVELHYF